MVDARTTDQALDEVADAQASMDPTRSECVRPTILDHFHRWMRAKSMTDKFMELDGLIRACLPHMTNSQAVKDVLDRLDDPILRQDILTKNADKYLTGVPIGILEMNECWTRYPLLADIWDIVQKDLVRSGLLPWALSYPEKALDSYIYSRLMERVEEKRIAREREKFAAERPPARLPAAIAAPSELATPRFRDEDLKTRDVPIMPRPESQGHAAYMSEQMAALHQEADMDGWTPDTLPISPAEIDVAAEKVKHALTRKLKKGASL